MPRRPLPNVDRRRHRRLSRRSRRLTRPSRLGSASASTRLPWGLPVRSFPCGASRAELPVGAASQSRGVSCVSRITRAQCETEIARGWSAQLAPPTRAKTANVSRLCLDALFFAIPWWGVRHERFHQMASDAGDFCHRAFELRLVRLRGLQDAAHLTHVLQSRRTDLLLGRRGRKIEQRANVAAHPAIVNTDRSELKGD